MKTIFCTIYFKLTLLLFVCTNVSWSQTNKKPNLLFIITDQQRYDALGVAGNSIIKTPNLDRLANRGARFEKAYTPCAVCAPARASILTGRTVENHGVLTNAQADTKEKKSATIMPMKTFDQILSENFGYHAEYYGKWHSPEFASSCYKNAIKFAKGGRSIFAPNGEIRFYKENYLDQVFPKRALSELQPQELYDTYTERPYTPNVLDKRYGMTQIQVNQEGKKYAQPDLHGIITIPDEHSLTAFRARNTIEALERLKDTPFSITTSFHFPHAPMLPSKYYSDMYPVKDMIVPLSIADPMTDSPYANANGRLKNPEYADPEKIKYMISDYYALITEIDDWVGKIIDKVDELGLKENTMIIFTSDHGENLGSHGMRDKNVFYEESARVPLLISFPGKIKPNTVVERYVSNIDLFATINDYLEIPEQPSDGTSLRGLIEGTDKIHGEFVVTEWHSDPNKTPGYMIVKDSWKMFIPFLAKSPVINALYNLKEDPLEMHNLMGSNPNLKLYSPKINELQRDLLSWLKTNNSKYYNEVLHRNLTGTLLNLSDKPKKATKNSLQIVANPTSKQLIIDSNNVKINGIELYDSTGKVVYSDSKIFVGVRKIDIDVKPGVYFINPISNYNLAPLKCNIIN